MGFPIAPYDPFGHKIIVFKVYQQIKLYDIISYSFYSFREVLNSAVKFKVGFDNGELGFGIRQAAAERKLISLL